MFFFFVSFMGSPLVLGPTVGDLKVSSKSRKKVKSVPQEVFETYHHHHHHHNTAFQQKSANSDRFATFDTSTRNH